MGELAIAESIVRVERDSLPRLRATLIGPSDRIALAVTSSRSVMVAIRREADVVEAQAYEAIVASRTEARRSSRKEQSAALLLLFGGKPKDLDLDGYARKLTTESIAADAASASMAARSLASAWGSSVMSTYSRWRTKTSAKGTAPAPVPGAGPYRTPGRVVTDEIRKTPTALDSRITRINTTEVVTAHNDEARQVFESLPPAVRAEVEYVWSAILDKGTCTDCASLDGNVTSGGTFRGGMWPPVHPRCRCYAYPQRKKA